ncbi:MAG: choice-of-anchor Q domain-containing protein [Pseudomonadota bacterium]
MSGKNIFFAVICGFWLICETGTAATPPDLSGLTALQSSDKSGGDAELTRHTLQTLPYRQGRITLTEPLVLQFLAPQTRFVAQLDDPAGDSIYAIEAFRGPESLALERFALGDQKLPSVRPAPDGMLSLSTRQPFDRVEIREIHGRALSDPEYVEALYAGNPSQKGGGNTDALICQVPLGLTYNVAFGVALVAFDPLTVTAANAAAYTSNLGLKFCKTVIEPPADIVRSVVPGQCVKNFLQPHMVAEYENALGVPLKFEYNWGQLGTPIVYHHNTEVEVSLQFDSPPAPSVENFSLRALLTDSSLDGTDAIYRECDDKNGTKRFSQLESGVGPSYECPYVVNRELAVPVGENTLVWRANAKMGLLDLFSPLIPGVPTGAKVPYYKSILLRVAQEALLITSDFFLGGWRWGNTSVAFQTVTIIDDRPPQILPEPENAAMLEGRITAILINDELRVQIEADEPGGVSTRRYEPLLKQLYRVFDPCDRPVTFTAAYPNDARRTFWPVSTQAQDQSFTITWTAEDLGPNNNGIPNQTPATMRVEVVDIRPPALLPPPDIVEITEQTVSELGQPLVFDFVDLDPLITNNANLPLEQGLTEVTWTATDASGNSTTAVQLVNLKASNADPTADAQTGANREEAVSFEPTTLRLTGSDPDGDPLRFFVEQYPENGFFVAPLYPYFVEDFRVARNVPTGDLFDQFCDPANSEQDFQIKYPVEPSFIDVSEDGRTFVMDRGRIDCRGGGTASRRPRIAVFPAGFDPDGSESPLAIQTAEPADLVVDEFTQLIVVTTNSSGGDAFVRTYDLALNEVQAYDLDDVDDRATGTCTNFGTNNFCEIREARSAVVDANGVLYVMDEKGRIYALELVDDTTSATQFIDYLSDDVTNNSNTNVSSRALALDADGFVYATRNNRIYKYGPSWVDADGLVQIGEPIGWLGRCDVDLAPGQDAVCDVTNRRSLGFSCTDATCIIDDAITQEEKDFCGLTFSNLGNFGCRPGQFRSPQGLDIDPRGNIYVADTANQRIQRFTPEGFFAGEAESECDGSCFVLGDFGNPQDISVNSGRFYILDPSTNLLHISLLTPFTDQGPDFAELVYQSNNDFGALNPAESVDQFTFSVSDGVRDPDSGQPARTAPATVEIAVRRNFRPPTATPGISAVALEDVETPIMLDGAELDPLDVLTFNLIDPPSNGSVIVVGDEARYLSDPNYVGPDSFTFAAFDGLDESAPERVEVDVLNVNDPPVVSPLDDAQVSTGFTFTLRHDFDDPDAKDLHGLAINWGDGTASPEGEIDMNGQLTGPILDEGDVGPGRITAEHVYTAPGSYTLEVCVTDQMVGSGSSKVPTAQSTTGCAEATVTVIDGLDLQLSSSPSSDAALPGQIVGYEFSVENLAPSAGAGQMATGVEMTIDVAPEFELSSIAAAGCQRSGRQLRCALADLGPGATAAVNVSARVPFDVDLGLRLRTDVRVTQDQSDQTPDNTLAQITPVLRPADLQVGSTEEALTDKGDVNAGDGLCASEDGVCTLRAAIEEANALPGQQSIALGSGTYQVGETAPLNVTDSLTLLGNGAERTIIFGGAGFTALVNEAGATLRLEDLTISSEGGGLSARGDLFTRGVRFTANRVNGSFGAAVFADANVDLRDTTFDGNQTSADGAALFNISGTSYLENVTVVGNRGGGLVFNNDATLVNLTITGNSGGCCWVTTSAALNAFGSGTEVTLVNSMLAGNSPSADFFAGPDSPPNCVTADGGSIVSLGNNLLGDLAGCELSPLPSDILAEDADLNPIGPNGVLVPTLNPRITSLLVDGGDAASCPAGDARGVTRPEDGNGDGSAACDIGAVELRVDGLFASGFESQ